MYIYRDNTVSSGLFDTLTSIVQSSLIKFISGKRKLKNGSNALNGWSDHPN